MHFRSPTTKCATAQNLLPLCIALTRTQAFFTSCDWVSRILLCPAMNPPEIIASANRANELLEARLKTAESEAAELQKQLEREQGESSKWRWQAEMKQMEVEGAHHQLSIAQAEAAQAHNQLWGLNRQLDDVVQAKGHDAIRAHHEIQIRDTNLAVLRQQLSRMERSSVGTFQASVVASNDIRAYFESQLAFEAKARADWNTCADQLSDHVKALEKDIDTQSRKHKEHEAELLRKLMRAEFNRDKADKRNTELQSSLDKNKKKLADAKTRWQSLVSARDSLNSQLAAANDALLVKVDKSKKEKASALAAASKTMKDKERLEQELKEKNAELKAQEKLENEIKGHLEVDEALEAGYQTALEEAEQLREECQKALDKVKALDHSANFWKGKDAENSRTIASLQRQVRDLKDAERIGGFEETIRADKFTIQTLLADRDRMMMEAKKKDGIVDKSLAKMMQQAKTVKKAKAMIQTLQGKHLTATNNMVEMLQCNKMLLSKLILSVVFTMLKHVRSTEEANQTVVDIRAYLQEQRD